MDSQVTNHIMMIRPVHFRLNEQTAVNNYYQHEERDGPADPQHDALKQFNAFVDKIEAEGVTVTVFEDSVNPSTPDSIFPNNWISFHQDGIIRLYPMYAQNRRLERRDDIINHFKRKYQLNNVISYTDWEDRGMYLEGTGSLILDRQHKIAYAAISKRTSLAMLAEFSKESGFKVISFHAYQLVGKERLPIYHTNVMMSIGECFTVICLDAVDDESEKRMLLDSLEATGKEIIAISEDQSEHFAGNILQVIGRKHERLLIMSTQAFNALSREQIRRLQKHGKIIHSDIHTIETLGGGGARCMMAEIFNPKLN